MGILSDIAAGIAANPVLSALVLLILIVIFGGYLFIRRIAISAKEGFEEGRG